MADPHTDVEGCMTEYKELVYRSAQYFRHVAQNKGIGLDELVEEGNFALFHACRTFNPDREATFSTYATSIIERALQRFINPKLSNVYREIRSARTELEKELGRAPTPEEVAFSSGHHINRVRAALQDFQIIPLEDPAKGSAQPEDNGGRTVLEQYESAEKSHGYESNDDDHDKDDSYEKISKRNRKLSAAFERIVEQSQLSLEEYLVIKYRWGMDQAFRPRPRKAVIRLWKSSLESKTQYASIVESLPERLKDGQQIRNILKMLADYSPSKIRIVELRAAKKVAIALQEH
jgi:RNA polymerase sigma factor (sigma-70 family)